jgi:hypothetical protein
MDYPKFVGLINGGEKHNVDFKIKCDAFQEKSLSSKAELAKDICAMSNNGNIVSYIIIGVSDDGKNYLSVANPNLNDDALQDFCKKSLSPPPKVKLIRKSWVRADSKHKNKEFVILQVGPHKRQAFRLAQDFIDYSEKICFRRNEVWIRRGATTDLATPEEIGRLITGKPIEDTPIDISKQEERNEFNKLSVVDKLRAINRATNDELRKLGFKKAKEQKRLSTQEEVAQGFILRRNDLVIYIKRYTSYIMAVHVDVSKESLTQNEIEWMELRVPSWYSLVIKNSAPSPVSKQDVLPIRRLLLQPVLANVPRKRIQTALKTWKWAGNCSHYFMTIRGIIDSDTLYPSSTELLIIDNITSVADYRDKLLETLRFVEENENTICSPITV